MIALTFDDGPGPYTPDVLSVLQHYHVPATFFEVGEEVAALSPVRQDGGGCRLPVEDHTWSHPDLTTLPTVGVAAQIDMTQAEIQAVTGTTPQCLRPPYDAWNATVLSQISALGLTTMSYSVDPRDWTLPGVQAIVNRVVGAAFPGAVVDMHDGGGDRSETVAALPQIITQLRAMGYWFVSICGAGATAGPQVTATYAFGNAPVPGPSVTSNVPLVGAAATPDGGGYWEVASDGGIFSFGDAAFHGSMGGQPAQRAHRGHGGHARRRRLLGGGVRRRHLLLRRRRLPRLDGRPPAQRAHRGHGGHARRRRLLGGGVRRRHLLLRRRRLPRLDGRPPAQRTHRGHGGHARRRAATGRWRPTAASSPSATPPSTARWAASPLNQPIVGMAATPDGGGYWEVASDGGIFSFGAPFYGSRGGRRAGPLLRHRAGARRGGLPPGRPAPGRLATAEGA